MTRPTTGPPGLVSSEFDELCRAFTVSETLHKSRNEGQWAMISRRSLVGISYEVGQRVAGGGGACGVKLCKTTDVWHHEWEANR